MDKRPKPFSGIQRWQSNAFWLAEHLLGARRSATLFGETRKKHWDLLHRKISATGKGRTIEVQKFKDITPAEFKRKYYRKCIPVVLEGAAKNWEACKTWSPQYFADHYGKELSAVTDYGDEEFVSLEEAVNQMRRGQMRASHFSKIVHNTPALLAQLDLGLLKPYISRLSHTTSYQFFMGPKGAITALHAGGTNNFHIQLYGEKTWRMIDTNFNPVIRPKITHSPLLQSHVDPLQPNPDYPTDGLIDTYIAHIKAGDILYIPTYFWHHVVYETDSIASGVRWFSPIDVWRTSVTMFLIMLTATNPSVFEYYLDITRGKLNRFYGSRRADKLER